MIWMQEHERPQHIKKGVDMYFLKLHIDIVRIVKKEIHRFPLFDSMYHCVNVWNRIHKLLYLCVNMGGNWGYVTCGNVHTCSRNMYVYCAQCPYNVFSSHAYGVQRTTRPSMFHNFLRFSDVPSFPLLLINKNLIHKLNQHCACTICTNPYIRTETGVLWVLRFKWFLFCTFGVE